MRTRARTYCCTAAVTQLTQLLCRGRRPTPRGVAHGAGGGAGLVGRGRSGRSPRISRRATRGSWLPAGGPTTDGATAREPSVRRPSATPAPLGRAHRHGTAFHAHPAAGPHRHEGLGSRSAARPVDGRSGLHRPSTSAVVITRVQSTAGCQRTAAVAHDECAHRTACPTSRRPCRGRFPRPLASGRRCARGPLPRRMTLCRPARRRARRRALRRLGARSSLRVSCQGRAAVR